MCAASNPGSLNNLGTRVGTRWDSQQGGRSSSSVSGVVRSLSHISQLDGHLPCSTVGETFIIRINESREASDLIDEEKIKTMIQVDIGNDSETKEAREGLFAGETEES